MDWSICTIGDFSTHVRYYLTDRKHAVFTSLNSKKWWCDICPGQTFQKLSIVLRHEASAAHVRAVRCKDVIDFTPEVQLQGNVEHDVSFDPSATTGTRPAALPESGVRASFPYPEPFFAELCDDLYESMTAADQFMSRTHLHSIHGPALEDDDPEQLYNNWSGALGATSLSEDLDGLADREDALRDPSVGSDNPGPPSGSIPHKPDFGLELDFAAFQKAIGKQTCCSSCAEGLTCAGFCRIGS